MLKPYLALRNALLRHEGSEFLANDEVPVVVSASELMFLSIWEDIDMIFLHDITNSRL